MAKDRRESTTRGARISQSTGVTTEDTESTEGCVEAEARHSALSVSSVVLCSSLFCRRNGRWTRGIDVAGRSFEPVCQSVGHLYEALAPDTGALPKDRHFCRAQLRHHDALSDLRRLEWQIASGAPDQPHRLTVLERSVEATKHRGRASSRSHGHDFEGDGIQRNPGSG
jgi:hypothetical protein